MNNSALRLPRISISDKSERSSREWVLKDLKDAPLILTFYADANKDYNLLYTDLSEKEFDLLLMIIHRNVEVFEFIKLVVLTVEDIRQDPAKSSEFITRAVNYIKHKKK